VNPDRTEAALALDDIEAVVKRVRVSLFYRQASVAMILWGIVVAIGYALSYAFPAEAGRIWLSLDVVGFVAMIVLLRSSLGEDHGQIEWRLVSAIALFYAFGFLWSSFLGRFGAREIAAFWPTLIMFGYTVAGLWLGRAFIFIGVALTALTLVGYLSTGPWFNLYLAVVNGGGLILCGIWMRRA
jgi:hypothetical protein